MKTFQDKATDSLIKISRIQGMQDIFNLLCENELTSSNTLRIVHELICKCNREVDSVIDVNMSKAFSQTIKNYKVIKIKKELPEVPKWEVN